MVANEGLEKAEPMDPVPCVSMGTIMHNTRCHVFVVHLPTLPGQITAFKEFEFQYCIPASSISSTLIGGTNYYGMFSSDCLCRP